MATTRRHTRPGVCRPLSTVSSSGTGRCSSVRSTAEAASPQTTQEQRQDRQPIAAAQATRMMMCHSRSRSRSRSNSSSSSSSRREAVFVSRRFAGGFFISLPQVQTPSALLTCLVCVVVLLFSLNVLHVAPTHAAVAGCPALATVHVSVSGRTVGCCGSEADPCGTLQLAVDMLSTPGPSSIVLGPGKHKVNSAKGIDVSGLVLSIVSDSPGAATIDCSGGRCLVAECAGGAAGALPSPTACAGALLTIGAVTVSAGVSPTSGGCLSVSNQDVVLRGTRFTSCSAIFTGGAVAISNARRPVLDNVTFADSSVATPDGMGGGGCLSILNSANAILSGVEAQRCFANESQGGAILLNLTRASVTSLTVSSSVARLTGGGVQVVNSTVTGRKVDVSSCQAAAGGGIDVSSSAVTLDRASFSTCAATPLPAYPNDQPYGGGMQVRVDSSLSLTRSIFSGCSAGFDGGGMYFYLNMNKAIAITDSTFEGCLSFNPNTGGGGAMGGSLTNLRLSNVTFQANSVSSFTGLGGAMNLQDCNTTISRCSFMGNRNDQSMLDGIGGAVFVTQAPNLPMSFVVEDSLFQDNVALVTGAVACQANQCEFYRTRFINNAALSSDAGALTLYNGAILKDCVFRGNSAYQGGGALRLQAQSASVSVSQCIFDSNFAQYGDGGGVMVEMVATYPVDFTNCTFVNNTAERAHGGAAVASGPATTFTQCRFFNNSASFKGGALDVEGEKGLPVMCTVDLCEFRHNRAELGGGAISVAEAGNLTVSGSTLHENDGAAGGAVVVEQTGMATLFNSTCSMNRAPAGGGCLSAGDSGVATLSLVRIEGNVGGNEGGALRATSAATVRVNASTVRLNAATDGGVVWLEMLSNGVFENTTFADNNATLQGGVIYMIHKAKATVTGCTFRTNSGRHGGAITAEGSVSVYISSSTFLANALHAIVLTGDARATVLNSSFTGNVAPRTDGGAILASDNVTLSISRTNFTGNVARRGGAVFADSTSEATVDACEFVKNMAVEGAGVYAGGTSVVHVSACGFTKNAANETGAGIMFSGSSLGSLNDSSFSANRASEGGAAVYLERGLTSPRGDPNSVLSSTGEEVAVGPMPMENLVFKNNEGPMASQGSAYLDASYSPGTRSNCSDCSSSSRRDSVGSLPVAFRMMWAGSNDSANSSAPFVVKGDKQNPIQGLHVYILDAFGHVTTEDFSTLVEIEPRPEVSGLLRGTADLGVAAMPPIIVFSAPDDGSTTITLNITVSSAVDAFPPVTRELVVQLCDAGQYFEAKSKTCNPCPIGSWCGTGLGKQFCPINSYSFFPGATSVDNCTQCPTLTDRSGSPAVQCDRGFSNISFGFWMDSASLAQGMTVYSCDVLDGCMGFTYSGPDDLQCSAEYTQNRLCSTCASGYYSMLKDCYQCGSTFTQLFPLFVVLILLAWIAMGCLSDAFHTIAIFVIEAQMLTFIATYNLPFPDWVTSVIHYLQIALFIPDVIGPSCSVTYSYTAQWAIAMIIPLAGVAVYGTIFLLFRLYVNLFAPLAGPGVGGGPSRVAASSSPSKTEAGAAGIEVDEERPATPSTPSTPAAAGAAGATQRDVYDSYHNALVHGVTNWLDLCYAGVTYRCFQAFYSQYYGAWVMGAAPTITWFSSTHTLIFVLSVVIMAVYIIGAPVTYALVLWWGKANQRLNDHTFKTRWGWMVDRYEYEYFWWHLTCFARRIILASIAVFGVHNPEVQLSVTLPIQAIRIGAQYGASPFTSFSHDILNSILALGEFLFTVALVGYNYIDLPGASQGLFGLSLAFLFVPTLLILAYESLNKYISSCNNGRLERVWEQDKLGKSFKSRDRLFRLSVNEVVHPKDIAGWFRPHVLYAFLQHSSRKDLKILLRVRDRFEQCRLAGLGNTAWMKHLTKSQLYAVLSQALLGAAVGEVTIARMPVRGNNASVGGSGGEDAGEASIDEIQLEGGVEGGWEEGDEVAWPPRLDKHVSWTEAEEGGQEGERLVLSHALYEEEEDGQGEEGEDSAHEREGVNGAAVSGASGGDAHAEDAGLIVRGREGNRFDKKRVGSFGSLDAAPVNTSSPKVGTPGLPPRTPPSAHAVAAASAAAGGSVGASPLPPSGLGPSLSRSASGRPPLAPRGPSAGSTPPPPAGGRVPSFVSTGRVDSEKSTYVEARMNMADLTLTFQRHLAMLVRAESSKTVQSLRLLLKSEAIPQLLAWLTSSASTPEDQMLVRQMVDLVREQSMEAAGGLQWYHGDLYFLRTHRFFPWGRKPTKKAPMLADIAS